MAKLTEQEVRRALAAGDLPGWRYERGEIFKHYKFRTFMEAIAFINRVAERAEAMDHHPDLENHYNRVRVGLHTWSESGVTEKDLALAREIEAVAEPPA
ncbi:MAG TPA: 4a-hydroxytetrahydrobiopterin dehydratase [Actinomycetota bacterium]|nr:4a-hydroxytetrahydrobiopterin dehydratase [Actinomycetota bacterium]